MGVVNPTADHIQAFAREAPDDEPIVMLNLLRFRDRADYGGSAGGEVSGRTAYDRYSKAVLPLLFEVGGLPLWMGKARANVIAPEGESWDEVLLVHYPARRAFLRMVESEAYQAIMHHRTAALADSRLIETRAAPLPSWILRAGRAAVRAKARFFPKIAP